MAEMERNSIISLPGTFVGQPISNAAITHASELLVRTANLVFAPPWQIS